jgi:hypothetical protein
MLHSRPAKIAKAQRVKGKGKFFLGLARPANLDTLV